MICCMRSLLLCGLLLLGSGLVIRVSRAERNDALALFLGYSKAIHSVALSPDGRQAVSGGRDNLVRLWDVATGLLLRTFDAHTGSVNAIALSVDGRLLLAGGDDARLRLWDVISGQLLAIMEGHEGELLSVAFSPIDKRAVSAGKDKTIRLWDLETGQTVRTFDGHTDDVLSVAFSADGQRLLSAAKDKTLRLWNAETGELVTTFEGHGDAVTSATFSPGGAYAMSASKDRTAKLWDLATGKLVKTLEGHADEVLSVSFSRDGKRALSASKDRSLRLWDVESGTLLRTFEGHADAVTSAIISADGRLALSGSLDKTLKLWDVETGQLKSTIDLQSVTFSPSGYQNFFSGVSISSTVDPAKLDERLKEKGFRRGSPVFLRIFKADLEVELWIKSAAKFELFATYPICAWSGELGPKLQEGDSQSPEGFYTIAKSQLNPNSHYHRAFNLGYPNLLDRAYNRTGNYLMIHGGCASVGCYAMTDPGIDEMWQLVTAALDGGQERVAVHVFPFRMTKERLAAFDWHPWIDFWRDLKPAYDFFEETHILPQISVCDKRYAVARGHVTQTAPILQSACPVKRTQLRQSRF